MCPNGIVTPSDSEMKHTGDDESQRHCTPSDSEGNLTGNESGRLKAEVKSTSMTQQHLFRRVLIANRGEVAARVIRACHALGIETVAVHSTADASSPYLAAADRCVCIGPGPAKGSYLNMDAILQAAEQTDCQALHPGFGFLAENPLFAARVRQQQLAWIGPPPHLIAQMGDKATARRVFAERGIPPIPGSPGTLCDVDQALQVAQEVGYPVLLKATAGGGGKGIRRCHDHHELRAGFVEAAGEAEKAFANPGLYLEKVVTGARHVEFQVLADRFGHAVHLGERDCSIQRRHQKLLEEAPCPVMTEQERVSLGARIAATVAALGYVSAGTVELLRDHDGRLYFMEMNTRLQVEHPVTEMITGVDIVEHQIRVAANQPLALRQDEITSNGHALEMRINAEDPERGFAPDPGTIETFVPPQGKGVRLDTHISAGARIPPFYDSMVAKLVVWGKDREQARQRAVQALDNLEIEGVATTKKLHKQILTEPAFCSASYDVTWLERRLSEKAGGL